MNRTKVVVAVVAASLLSSVGAGAALAWRRDPAPAERRITHAMDLVKKKPRSPWLSRRPSRGASGVELDPYGVQTIASEILYSWDEEPWKLRYVLGRVPKNPFLDRKWFWSLESPSRKGGGWSMRGIAWTRGPLIQPFTIQVTGQRGTISARLDRDPAFEIRTLDQAISFARSYVAVPIVLPDLTGADFEGALVHFGHTGIASGKLTFDVEGHYLTIQYGDARFDGCGEGNLELEIAGLPAIAQLSEHANHLLWPKTDLASGTDYGLYGDFDIDTLVAWAEQMERKRDAIEGNEHSSGC